MNSPQEPASPSASTPSESTPPPDAADQIVEPVPSNIPTATLTDNPQGLRGPASQTKRRLPTGSSSMHGSRDSKARRRDDGGNAGKRGMGGAMGAQGVGGEGREGRMKEDLVDMDLMDKLKKEFGDPFDEAAMHL